MKRLLLIFTLSFCYSFSFSQNPIDSAKLDAFMDGQIQTLMQELDINGVTVSVVKGQELFWSKGYGWADEKEGIKVDPAESLFRMGSISKMFVWTAVMQLYEDGKLNLDTDIRSYIEDFEIDDSFEEPITMKHLMSHSAGFEDYYIQLFSADTVPPNSLGEELKEHNPGRIRPPGVHSSYSNHGTGMAAYIVERISGLKWEDYVQQNIFDPLGMTRSTFAYRLPPEFKKPHSQGYTYSGGKYSNHPFKGVPLAPVGIASTTAEDMVPFMVAHMNHGAYKEFAMLDSSTSALMQTTLHAHTDGIRGMCYGFFDHSRNGYKIVGHGGATEYFFSYMLLMPDEDVGIFISTNTQGGVDLIGKATNAFFDRFFPNTTEPNEIELSEEELQAYSGSYLSNRRPHNRFTKIIGILNTPVEVSSKDGKLWTSGSSPKSWIPIGPDLFQDSKSTTRLAFEKNDLGEYKYMYMDSSPHVAMERISTIESRSLNIFVLVMSLGLGVFALIIWLVNYFLKQSYSLSSARQLPVASKFIAMVNVFLLIAFAFAFGATLDSIFEQGVKKSHYITFVISAIFGLLALFQFILALGHFRKDIKLRSSIFYLLLSLGMLALLFMMNYWNLIGFKLT